MSANTSDAEEEILLYAAFDDSIDVNHFRSIHVLGINESNPIIQMDDTFFTGEYENALGTYMFFEEDLSAQSEDPLLDRLPKKNLKYVTKTRKLLEMKQAYVTAKEDQDIQCDSIEHDSAVEVVSFSNLEAAQEKFRDEFKLEKAEAQLKLPDTETEVLKSS
ncbi:general transcription factor 3C polypeptide 6-like [Amyelois transitella]|uniref:general transcription factor 3C polypeptide 6-like n=1 Tax=Amyelois transitella TaxID=680683 RepID=UPI00298F934E|nr:general transcription factor 3C polypeptide 6-like [Amyelois transitella]